MPATVENGDFEPLHPASTAEQGGGRVPGAAVSPQHGYRPFGLPVTVENGDFEPLHPASTAEQGGGRVPGAAVSSQYGFRPLGLPATVDNGDFKLKTPAPAPEQLVGGVRVPGAAVSPQHGYRPFGLPVTVENAVFKQQTSAPAPRHGDGDLQPGPAPAQQQLVGGGSVPGAALVPVHDNVSTEAPTVTGGFHEANFTFFDNPVCVVRIGNSVLSIDLTRLGRLFRPDNASDQALIPYGEDNQLDWRLILLLLLNMIGETRDCFRIEGHQDPKIEELDSEDECDSNELEGAFGFTVPERSETLALNYKATMSQEALEFNGLLSWFMYFEGIFPFLTFPQTNRDLLQSTPPALPYSVPDDKQDASLDVPAIIDPSSNTISYFQNMAEQNKDSWHLIPLWQELYDWVTTASKRTGNAILDRNLMPGALVYRNLREFKSILEIIKFGCYEEQILGPEFERLQELKSRRNAWLKAVSDGKKLFEVLNNSRVYDKLRKISMKSRTQIYAQEVMKVKEAKKEEMLIALIWFCVIFLT